MSNGRVWKYGEDVNTDVIFPGKYTYSITDPEEMALHSLEDLDPNFVKEVKPGDIILAGKNFGCGSSREQAAVCLKYNGIAAIIAKSFSRIFFRNAINAGLLVIENSEVYDLIESGDIIELNIDKGEIIIDTKVFNFPPLPESVKKILDAGGLINYIKNETEQK